MDIPIHCAYDELVDIATLRPHHQNRNKHSAEQIERLAQIIQYQGIRSPIKVSRQTHLITAGHGRLEAFKRLKLKQIPVNYQSYENEEQEYADLQSDNAIASWAELDLSGINADIPNLGPDFDIDLLGIKDFVLEPADKIPQCDEDEVPEHVEPKAKLGDIYKLGEHRLMCGDSSDVLHIDKMLNGESANFVYCDPPYGINLETDYRSMKSEKTSWRSRNTNTFKPIENDNKAFDPTFLIGFFSSARELFLWGADYYSERLIDKNEGSWVVWDKRTNEQLDKMYGSAFELCWSRERHKRDIARITWAGCAGHVKSSDGDRKVHPTQKSVRLHEWFFEKWGKPNDNVVDLFGGSGSTLIACEKTNRKCFMMEIDPHYVDVIVARWEKYTGKKAELINGET